MTTKSPVARRRARRCRAAPSARAGGRAPRRSPRRRPRPRGGRPRGPCTRRAWPSGGRRSRSRSVSGSPWPGRSPQVEVGLADRHDLRRVDRRRVPGADRVAHRLVEHGVAAHPLDDHRRRRLAGAEAGDAHAAAEPLGGLRDALARPPSAGTSASTRTRDSGSSVTVVGTSVAMAANHCTSPGHALPARPRFYTGPLGHLAAGVADWAELLARWKWSQLVSRFKRARSRR